MELKPLENGFKKGNTSVFFHLSNVELKNSEIFHFCNFLILK